jgi:pSer/pThr/pTyr-binding forkhead associated (FHA) protein
MEIMIAVSAPGKPEREVKLSHDVVVGRGKTANLRIISNEVSREHCRLIVADDRIAIHDLGSSNGTQLNGTTIEAQTDVLLASGSRLEIGPLKLVVRFDESLMPSEFTEALKAQNAQVDALDELIQNVEELDEPIFDDLEGVDDTEITEPNATIDPGELEDTVAIMGPSSNEPETGMWDADEGTEIHPPLNELQPVQPLEAEPQGQVDPVAEELVEEQPKKLKGLFGLFRRDKKSAEAAQDLATPEADPNELQPAAEATAADATNADATRAVPDDEAAELLPLDPDDEDLAEVVDEEIVADQEVAEEELPEDEPNNDDDATPGLFPEDAGDEWDEYLAEGDAEEDSDGDVDPGFADFLNDIN